jgi:hypothetical protein
MKRLAIDASGFETFDGTNELNNIDYQLPETKIASGGELIVKGALFGDWAKAQIVHPSGFVITQYADKIYLKPISDGYFYAQIDGGDLNTVIPQDLILRVVYYCNGISGREAVINYAFEKTI